MHGMLSVLKVCLLHRQGTQLSILAFANVWSKGQKNLLARISHEGDRKQDVHGIF